MVLIQFLAIPIFCFMSFFVPYFVHETKAAEINEYLAFPFVRPSSSSESDVTLGIGFGFSFNFNLNPIYSIETGLTYISKSYGLGSEPDDATYRASYFQIPTLLRYRLSETFSGGGGIYISQGMGNIVKTQGDNKTTLGFPDLSWSKYDLGLVANIRYKKLVYEFIHIFVDGRILFGLFDINKSGDQSLYNREFQLLTGFGFSL